MTMMIACVHNDNFVSCVHVAFALRSVSLNLMNNHINVNGGPKIVVIVETKQSLNIRRLITS